jgi:hypothetical protein
MISKIPGAILKSGEFLMNQIQRTGDVSCYIQKWSYDKNTHA